MYARNVVRALGLGVALAWVAVGNAEVTSVAVRQTLDTVQVFGPSDVLERVQDPDAALPADRLRYDSLGLMGTNLRACQLTSGQGLFCLDGNTVRQWRNTKSPGAGEALFECRDIDVLDPRAADLCTGLTVESSGEVLWIAGRNKSKSFTLLRVSAEPASCPGPTAQLKDFSNGGASLPYHYCVWATGRPLLVDISPVEGSVAENFQVCDSTGCGSGKGLLTVEERRKVVFFPAAQPGRSYQLASSRTGWGLNGNEQLSAASVLQIESSSGSLGNFVLATTNRGRVLSAPTTAGAPANQVAQLSVCSGTDPQYGIRASAKSGLVYATNRLCKSIVVYDPSLATASTVPALSPVSSETESLSLFPNGPTIAAGRGFSAAECEAAGTCDLIVADNGTPSVRLIGVNVDDPDRSGVVLFQVENVPDCRWLRQAARNGGPAAPAICTADTIYDPNGANDAAGQYLNVTPLLPREITDLYTTDPLPPLYVSPQYRAQPENNFRFAALFAKPEEGLVYRDTFELEFEVGLLTGREFLCRSSTKNNLPASSLSDAARLQQLLAWDVASKVSENFDGIGPGGDRFDSVINFECGSSRTIVGRSSFFPYNLVITPDTFVGGRLVRNNDAVFGHLLIDLYNQLGAVLRNYAGVSGDGQSAGPPLNSTDFNSLASRWDNGKVLLDRCFEATRAPRQNAAPNNCQSFLSQLSEFRKQLETAVYCDASPGVTAIDCDPANRRGELDSRATVIDFVYRDRFVPSVTAQGFCDGRTGITGTTC